MAKVRRELGSDVHLLHDVHHRLRPIEAARLGRDLEPHRLFWLEDPTPADNPESFRLIRQHTTTPLAVGEVFFFVPSMLWAYLLDNSRSGSRNRSSPAARSTSLTNSAR